MCLECPYIERGGSMRKSRREKLVLAAGLAGALILAPSGLKAEPGDDAERYAMKSGAATFQTYCSSCHGVEGRGDGPIAEHFKIRPADVTRISQRSGGEFPRDWVHEVIDGRARVRGHGEESMPVWGNVFQSPKIQPGGHVVDQGPGLAARRIDELVSYLASIQTTSDGSE